MTQLCDYLYQGSGGTIGDLLLSSHSVRHLAYFHKISVAIPQSLRQELKDLYTRHKFLTNIEELDDATFFDSTKFKLYAANKNYCPIVYLKDIWFLKDITFCNLNEWFDLQEKPTIDFSKCIGTHICSSSNWNRPTIPHVKLWLQRIQASNFKPYFFGTKKDEELLMSLYPEIKSWFTFEEDYWRFGKDSILQTMANISGMHGLIVFSSWSAYAAILQGVPVVELWNERQWQFYSPLVNRMLGGPVHYVAASYKEEPNPYLFTEIFAGLKSRYQAIHLDSTSLSNNIVHPVSTFSILFLFAILAKCICSSSIIMISYLS
jgi:hypothetical protein